MKYQIQLFLTAIMFFTRIPVTKSLPYSKTLLQQSARYFSWVGVIVGTLSALVWLLFNWLQLPEMAIFFSMLTSILVTGAFHEDGFADCCDAFGGGWEKNTILTIMKDSRLGTYGVVGLIIILLGKFLLLNQVSVLLNVPQFFLLLLLSHSTSRFMAVTVMQSLPYVQDIDSSKSKPLADRKLTFTELLIALFPVAVSFAFFPWWFCIVLVPVFLVQQYLVFYFKKWIGGYTGDCLGATQQVTEWVIYFCVLLAFQFQLIGNKIL